MHKEECSHWTSLLAEGHFLQDARPCDWSQPAFFFRFGDIDSSGGVRCVIKSAAIYCCQWKEAGEVWKLQRQGKLCSSMSWRRQKLVNLIWNAWTLWLSTLGHRSSKTHFMKSFWFSSWFHVQRQRLLFFLVNVFFWQQSQESVILVKCASIYDHQENFIVLKHHTLVCHKCTHTHTHTHTHTLQENFLICSNRTRFDNSSVQKPKKSQKNYISKITQIEGSTRRISPP